ncbi:MAG: hypothetical protein QXF15_01610 [Candidatus Aenigmatarchaeota archaeon]|nr:hypothetical protein [Candidatus Aenigmarchaeota archaeon]
MVKEETKNTLSLILIILTIVILIFILMGLLTGKLYGREFCLRISERLTLNIIGWNLRPLDKICEMLPI